MPVTTPPTPSCDNQKYLQALPSIAPPPCAFQGLIRTAPQERPLLHPCGACVLVCTSARSHTVARSKTSLHQTELQTPGLAPGSCPPCPALPCPSVRGGDSEPGGGGHLLELLQAAALAHRSVVSGYTRAGPGRKDGARSVRKKPSGTRWSPGISESGRRLPAPPVLQRLAADARCSRIAPPPRTAVQVGSASEQAAATFAERAGRREVAPPSARLGGEPAGGLEFCGSGRGTLREPRATLLAQRARGDPSDHGSISPDASCQGRGRFPGRSPASASPGTLGGAPRPWDWPGFRDVGAE